MWSHSICKAGVWLQRWTIQQQGDATFIIDWRGTGSFAAQWVSACTAFAARLYLTCRCRAAASCAAAAGTINVGTSRSVASCVIIKKYFKKRKKERKKERKKVNPQTQGVREFLSSQDQVLSRSAKSVSDVRPTAVTCMMRKTNTSDM